MSVTESLPLYVFPSWELVIVAMLDSKSFIRLLFVLIAQDLRGRWSGGILTWAWAIIQPLAQIGMYVIVFGTLMVPKGVSFPSPGAYLVYLCSGIFCWLAVSEALIRSSASLLESAYVIRSRPLPLLIYPLKAVGSAWVLGLVGFVGSLVIAPLAGVQPSWSWFLLPVPVISLILTTAGVALLLSPMTVLVRDTQQVLHLCLPLAFWATPIVYEPVILPAWAREVQSYNPLVPAVSSIHDLLLTNHLPSVWCWVALLVVPGITLSLGWFALGRLSAEVRDVL